MSLSISVVLQWGQSQLALILPTLYSRRQEAGGRRQEAGGKALLYLCQFLYLGRPQDRTGLSLRLLLCQSLKAYCYITDN